MKNNTVKLNGKDYDAHTGLAVDIQHELEGEVNSQRRSVASGSIHHAVQKSKTLRRQSLAAPQHTTRIKINVSSAQKPQHPQSSAISRFAPHPIVTEPREEVTDDIPAQSHALLDKVAERTAKQEPVHTTAQETKEHAIQKALSSAKHDEQPTKRRGRTFNLATASLALLLLTGYLTYINLPAISTRIAAAQAGIDASYPGYQPSGYSLAGPVAYADGQVSIAFAATAGPQNYTINEKRTSWDSSAVLENHVISASNNSYSTHQQGGLTIYTYDNGAAWVNGGILYTIEGDAPLSEDQVLKIAASL